MSGDEPSGWTGHESLAVLHALAQVLELGVLTVDRDLVVTSCNRWRAAASEDVIPGHVGLPLLESFPELRGGSTLGLKSWARWNQKITQR